jgi:hypothetical protein
MIRIVALNVSSPLESETVILTLFNFPTFSLKRGKHSARTSIYTLHLTFQRSLCLHLVLELSAFELLLF